MSKNSTMVLPGRMDDGFEYIGTNMADEDLEDVSKIGDYIVSAENTDEPQGRILIEEETESDNKEFPKTLRKDVEHRLKYGVENWRAYSHKFIGSYYSDVKEYHGLVEDVDEDKEEFTVILHPKNQPDKLSQIVFEFGDVESKSDLELIAPGVAVIWLYGYEIQPPGETRRHFARLIVRRTKVLTHQEKEEAFKRADEWYEFFRQFTSE